MEIKVTPEQLITYPNLQTLALRFIMLGGRVTWKNKTATYYIDRDGESFMSQSDIQVLLDSNVKIDGAKIYSPVVNKTFLETLMPEDNETFPGCYQPTEGEIEGFHKTYEEYFRPYQVGENQYVLQFAVLIDDNNNVRSQYTDDTGKIILIPTDEQIRLWITHFGGFLSYGEFLSLQSQYQSTIETLI